MKMSSDTGKGYASVADSSVTESKHGKRKLGIPGSILSHVLAYNLIVSFHSVYSSLSLFKCN